MAKGFRAHIFIGAFPKLPMMCQGGGSGAACLSAVEQLLGRLLSPSWRAFGILLFSQPTSTAVVVAVAADAAGGAPPPP